uniref:Uncharacterized mitochondrial protein AtMg00810-like n=1 Tax=Nicotiana tabacum TaxID=4097 RepID=A0A1S3XJT9_TOBAC|nr:PREDICTED: uncharacterized mitochondrial protein AtMg00810-like [Nicotiana tabacum]
MDMMPLPPGKKAIGCRWVYKIKYKVTCEVERFKARLVVKGYSQREGLDYEETFSPVVKMSHSDYSLFTTKVQGKIMVVLVYVDDLLIKGDDAILIQETKEYLQQVFKIKDLGELEFFLVIEFSRSKEGILMHQRKYALELISDMGLSGSKTIRAPLEANKKLTTLEFDTQFGIEDDKVFDDPSTYQRLVRKLLYLTMTRPDIAFAVQCLSQFMHCPKTSHVDAAIKVIEYIKQSPDLGIIMSADVSSQLTAYCAADWASCPNTRRSITGYLIKFGSSLISWKSKKQTTISRSSAEAEYRSLASTVVEILWVTGLIKELGVHIRKPISLLCDSKSAIQIAANPVFHERIKHIDINCHFIREKVQLGLVHLLHIPSLEQHADILTKSLGATQHHYLLSKLGMKNIFIAPSLRVCVKELANCLTVH